MHKLKNKSSHGYDNISNELLKRASDIIVKPLTLIVNQSLSTCIFPKQLTIYRVKPLLKKIISLFFSNYRPLLLLPSISRIFEYVIFVNVWLKANKLSLNVAKTKFMVFHTSNKIVNHPKLKINDHVMERVQSFNFLGLLVHYNMTWSKHIERVSLKISGTIGILNRLKLIYPQCPTCIIHCWRGVQASTKNIHYIYYRRKLYVW